MDAKITYRRIDILNLVKKDIQERLEPSNLEDYTFTTQVEFKNMLTCEIVNPNEIDVCVKIDWVGKEK